MDRRQKPWGAAMSTRKVVITIDGKSFTYEGRLDKRQNRVGYLIDLLLVYEGNDLTEARDAWASAEGYTITDSNGKERPKRGNLLSESTTPAGTAATAPAVSLLAQRTNAFMGRIRP